MGDINVANRTLSARGSAREASRGNRDETREDHGKVRLSSRPSYSKSLSLSLSRRFISFAVSMDDRSLSSASLALAVLPVRQTPTTTTVREDLETVPA